MPRVKFCLFVVEILPLPSINVAIFVEPEMLAVGVPVKTFLNANLRSSMPEAVEISQALLEYFKDVFPLTSAIFLNRRFPPKTV